MEYMYIYILYIYTENDHIYIYIRIYIYMVVDLKVLVRSFNCESRACYVGNPRESFFQVRESNIFIREEWPFPIKEF